MRDPQAKSLERPTWRVGLLCLAPLLAATLLSLACNAEMFEYGKHFRATEEFVRAQSTAYSHTVRATSTAEAPEVSATATAIAVAVLDGSPDAVRSLHERFGLILVPVPAGEFLYGTDLPDADQHAETSTLEEFWVGLNEVTNRQFAAFVDAGGYDDFTLWTDMGRQWLDENAHRGPVCQGNAAFNAPEQPQTCVSLYEAEAYAVWLSRESGVALRLPTAEEWEKAARGADGRRYPWGNNAPNAELAVYAAALGQTGDVGSRPHGASPCGALDMAGNVSEWTSTPSSFDTSYVVRGGSWFDYADALVSSHNRYYQPETQEKLIGFRLVADMNN
jgi:formylglycine-generating enzyme required for sulfatase activity